MAGSLCKVMIIGNVGKDPEIRSTKDGKKIANLSVATSESWKDKNTGERKEKTEWHKVAIFNDGLVNVVEKYINKGSKIYIEGALQTRKWTDKDGVDKYSTEIVLKGFGGELLMLDSKGDSVPAAPASAPQNDFIQSANESAELNDEIPF